MQQKPNLHLLHSRAPANLLLPSGILVLCVIIYFTGLTGPFFLDDFANIVPTNLDTYSWHVILETLSSNHSGWLGRPIPTLTFIANYAFFGDSTFSFKALNLILHLASGIALYYLGERILRQLIGQSTPQTRMVAFLAASLWLLHPLHVSTVLYVVQRMAQLSSLFMIFGLLLYVAGRQRMLATQKSGLLLCVLGIVLFTPLAALSKENGLMLPAFILLAETTLFKLSANSKQEKSALLLLLILVCLVPIIFGTWYVVTHLEHFIGGYASRNFSLTERLLTQIHAIYFYLQLTFWPLPASMSLYHDDFPITRYPDTQTVLLFTGLLTSIVVAVYWIKKAPLATFGILWFLLAHAVESTFLPLEMVFEHRNYMAIWGLLLIFVLYSNVLLHRVGGTINMPSIRTALVLLLLASFSLFTYFRAASWKDHTTFTYSHFIDHPNSTRSLIGMSGLYLSLGDTTNARQLIDKASALNPSEPGLALFKLYSYCHEGAPPTHVIEQALAPLAKGAWSIYTQQMIYSLYLATNKGECPNVRRSTVLEFTQAVLKYHPIPRRDSLELHIAHAGLLADIGEHAKAKQLFSALYNNPMSMPPSVRSALLRKSEEFATPLE